MIAPNQVAILCQIDIAVNIRLQDYMNIEHGNLWL
jgi:hypothetical protein